MILTKGEVSHSAKEHDSSTGLNRSIYTAHYTEVGFPIFIQGWALGVSQSGEVVLFPFWREGGHFISLNHNSPTSPPHTTTTHKTANRRDPGKDASKHRPSKTKRPVRGCQAGSGWVKGARLAPQCTAPAPKSLSPGRCAAAAFSLHRGTSPVLCRAPGTARKMRK